MKSRTIWALLLVAFTSTVGACTTSPDDMTDADDTLPDPGPVDPADGTDAGTDAGPTPDPITAAGPTITRTYTESNVELVNPERGYYTTYDLRGAGDASRIRTGAQARRQRHKLGGSWGLLVSVSGMRH